MNTFLWVLVFISFYFVFLVLRAKFALKNIEEGNKNFKNNNDYLEIPRESAPARAQKFIRKHAPEVEAQGYTLLYEFSKPKDSSENYHVIYVSENREITVELCYQRLNLPTRFLMGICFSSLCFKPNVYVLGAECNFENGEAVFTAVMEEAPFPKWIHATFLEKGAGIKELLEAHERKLNEVKENNGLEPLQINNIEDFCEKERKQREKLSRRMEVEFEELVAENNVEWLVEDDDQRL